MDQLSTSAQLLAKIWTANNYLSKKIDIKLSVHGINLTEFLVMLFLNNQHERQARRADLAEHIGITASGITRMLAPMERIGLVQKEKNARDARVSIVKLTESGASILGDALTSLNDAADGICASMTPEEIESLYKKFCKLSPV